MLDIPIRELLAIWSELDDCLHGKNGYGGNDAQIYAYRLTRYNPTIHSHGGFPKGTDSRAKAEIESHQAAVDSLLDILSLFAEMRQCSIIIDGEPMSGWHRKNWDFSHRATIGVRAKE